MSDISNPNEGNADAILKAYLDDLAAGVCPHCQAEIKERKQIGRCVYAFPCGHRLYQGRAPDKPTRMHPYLQGKDAWEEI